MNKIKRVGEKKNERPIKSGDIFACKFAGKDEYYILTRNLISLQEDIEYHYALFDIQQGRGLVSFDNLPEMVDYIHDSDLIRLERGDKIEIEVG